MSFSDRLRKERRRLRLTQVKTAEIGGVSVQSQRKYESDKRVPTATYLEMLAKEGFDIQFLVTGHCMLNDNNKVLRAVLGKNNLNANDIIYALSLVNKSPSQIAKELNVSRPSVCQVISGRNASIDIADHIAITLGTSKQKLWGDKYTYTPRKTSKRDAA